MRERTSRQVRTLLPIPLAALLAVLPMLLRGNSCGHDFDFHLLSWLEAATQLAHLHYPHWAYTPAFNAGEPRFIFYPPLSWSLGALLGLLLPWAAVPAAYTWIALTLAGLTFRHLALRYTAPGSATLAALLYLANPYMLFTAYERSAFAELLAAAWLPLLLAAALPRPVSPLLDDPRSAPRHILRVALPVALVWLTNAPAAVMFSYALAFLTVVRLLRERRVPTAIQLASTTAAGTLLGLALAAIYIVPAAYERRFVQIGMVIMEGMRVDDHFLFHRMAGNSSDDLFHNAVVRSASWIVLGLLAAIALAAFAAARRRLALDTPSRPSLITPLLLLAGVIAFLLTPPSLVLWHHLPQLAYLQFPWRLGAILGAILALLIALALPARPRSPAIFPYLSLLVTTALVLTAWLLFHQSCDLEDAIPARVALYHSPFGTDATDEYTPQGADPDALSPHNPPYWLLPAQNPGSRPYSAPAATDAPAPAGAQPGQAPSHLQLNLPAAMYLVLNRRAYPNWDVFRNHARVTQEGEERADGLIVITVSAGQATIDLLWHTSTDQEAGYAISATVLLLTAMLALFTRRRALDNPAYN